MDKDQDVWDRWYNSAIKFNMELDEYLSTKLKNKTIKFSHYIVDNKLAH